VKNYYDTLGVSQYATAEEINMAYRKLSVKFHPDKNENDSFYSELFKSINEAHSILSDPYKKEAYDNQLNSNHSTPHLHTNQDLLEAACIVVSYNSPSSSLLQRKMKIGFSKTNHLIDELESLGIVSQIDGNSRKILVNEDGLRNILLAKFHGSDLTQINQLLSVYRQKAQNEIVSHNKGNYTDVWSSTKAWRKIKWVLFIIDIILLVILLT